MIRRLLSLGAGVQSSTVYLMAVHGEFGDERPTSAIFADTEWEPDAVYRWLDELDGKPESPTANAKAQRQRGWMPNGAQNESQSIAG